jgi:hypothetical protein
MAIHASNKITVANKTFSLNALIANPDAYLPIMQPLFRANVFAKKSTETDEKYLCRLFTLLYTRQNPTEHSRVNRTRINLDESCDAILSALGIDIVKKCPKRTNVMFKSTGNSYRMNNEEILKLAEAVKHDVNFTVKHKLLNKKVLFGVELEFIGKKDRIYKFIDEMNKIVGSDKFVNAGSYNKNDGRFWILGTDCSVKPRGNQCGCGMKGYELTSPILNLSSKKDLKELETVCEAIKSVFGGEVNTTCGTHVHMSFPVEKATDELIMHFARSYRKSESSLFDKLVPPGRRENKARYAKTVSIRYLWDRYRKLNFNKVKKDSDNMHLEFRQLNGTLEYNNIISWVKLQKLFCELTLESWNINTADENKPVKIELDDVIVTKKLGKDSIEALMKMSKLVA